MCLFGLAARATPAVVVTPDGTRHVFVRFSDNSIHYITLNTLGQWGQWQPLGGWVIADPAAVVDAGGRVHVFHKGSNNDVFQNTLNNGVWTGWASLGGALAPDESGMAAVVWPDGKLEIIGTKNVSGTYYATFRGQTAAPSATAPRGTWGTWVNKTSMSMAPGATVTAARMQNGYPQVFMRGSDNTAYRSMASSAGWAAWGSIGILTTSDVAVAVDPSGRHHAFVRGTNGSVYSAYQTAANGSTWSVWTTTAGGAMTPGTRLSAAYHTRGPGLGIGTAVRLGQADGRLWNHTSDATGNTFGGTQRCGLYPNHPGSGEAAIFEDYNGYLVVVAADMDGVYQYTRETAPGVFDGTWQDVAAPVVEPFSLVMMGDTQGTTWWACATPEIDSPTETRTQYQIGVDKYFKPMVNWIVNQRFALDARYVIHVGDVNEWGDSDASWTATKSAMALFGSKVPYAIAPGNHDQDGWCRTSGVSCMASAASAGTGYTKFHAKFPPNTTDAQSLPPYPSSTQAFNRAYTFHAGGTDWLLITLTYENTVLGAGDTTSYLDSWKAGALVWAKNLVNQYPDRQVIITYHHSIAYDLSGWSAEGQVLFDEIAKPSSNVVLILGGHTANEGTVVGTATDGHKVYGLMFDPMPSTSSGSTGCPENTRLRLLSFDPASSSLTTRYIKTHGCTGAPDSSTACATSGAVTYPFTFKPRAAK
jgi:hypothetical protein